MSLNLLREFIVENVIDASGSFAKKRELDFRKKIHGAADEFQDIFRRQAEQERTFNDRLNGVTKIPDKFIKQKRLRMAVPSIFTDDNWHLEASIFDIVSHANIYDIFWEDLKHFVKVNAQTFQQVAMAMKQEMADIEREADELDWPASWRRYTQWNYTASSVNRFLENVKEMIR